MLESMNTNTLEYQRLTKDEMQKRGILGRLIGPCADVISPTRNGRKYPEQLWQNVFNDPIMKERIENGVCYGELGHPLDREETDMEKVALCLAEVPKKGKDGKLRAVFDIIDTPCGRILKSLCDYGSTIGISSRGSGDLETDFDGNESVNPDTYTCEGFDAVLIPAVKEARLQYVTESLNKRRYNKTLRQKLTESIDREDESNQKAVKESLNILGIDLEESINIESSTRKSFNDIQVGDVVIYNVDEFDGHVSQECIVLEVDTDHIIIYPKEDPDLKYWIDSDVDFNTTLTEAKDVGDDNGFLAQQKYHSNDDSKIKSIKQIERDLIDAGLDTSNGSFVKVKDLLITKPTDNNIYFTVKQANTEDVDSVVDKINSILNKYHAQNIEYNQADLLEDYVYCHGSCAIDLDNINEDYAFPGIHARYEVHSIRSSGSDMLLAGCEKIEQTTSAAEKQMREIFESPYLTADEKYNLIDNMYLVDVIDDKEVDFMSDFDSAQQDILNRLSQEIDNINIEENIEEVVNDESLMEELQKALKLNKVLDEKIVTLQEKLSVGYAKEVKLNEQIEGYKARILKLSKSTNEVKALNEKLNTLTKNNTGMDNRCKKLTESVQSKSDMITKLNESITKKNEDIKKLQTKLNESANNLKEQVSSNEELADKYETLNKDMNQLKESYSQKLEKQNQLIEKYKNIAMRSVDKYINTQATILGVRSTEIKNRLPESYSFKDIDKICEDLREYKLNMSSLPFSNSSTNLSEGVRIRGKNISNKTLVPVEEDIDELTLRMAGLI